VSLPHPIRSAIVAAAMGVAGLTVLAALASAADRPHSPFFPPIEVAGDVPTPDDTLQITGAPFQGVAGTGRGYVLLAPGHTDITNPILAVEGFDLDNSMDWDELYTLLNRESLIDSLRARGYDAVVLDFTDATTDIRRNAFVFTELLAQVEARIAPTQTVAVVGASMGGLVSRYGLAWLETHLVPHRVRIYVSFDTPQRGANIPLGVQHWVDFFASQSADAATFRDLLNKPAARQMLVYHFGSTAGTTAAPDPLRAALAADFTAVGGYPQLLRRVAFANGAGDGTGQGYAPGAKVIDYNYSNLLVTIKGDVWALQNVASGTVFQGRIRIFLVQDTQKTVTIAGARPYDSAPGGWRASMAQLAAVTPPYGDIVSLHDDHCFIPTVSALDLPDGDLYLNVAAMADPAASTPFDAVYWADSNEEHVFISPVTAQRLLLELEPPPVVGVGDLAGDADGASLAPRIERVVPNPSIARSSIAFALPRTGEATVRVVSVDGRVVTTLAKGMLAAGPHALAWDGRDDAGRSVAPGLYFAIVESEGRTASTRIVRSH
jgi:hypothetical protein